jgi:hypothetical protein
MQNKKSHRNEGINEEIYKVAAVILGPKPTACGLFSIPVTFLWECLLK